MEFYNNKTKSNQSVALIFNVDSRFYRCQEILPRNLLRTIRITLTGGWVRTSLLSRLTALKPPIAVVAITVIMFNAAFANILLPGTAKCQGTVATGTIGVFVAPIRVFVFIIA